MDRLDSRRFRLTLLALAVLALVCVAYVLLNRRLADPDMFWHIATGRWIVENRTVPTTDPFSWWAAPLHRPWVAQEWLFGLLVYGLYALGGFTAVYWFTALLNGLLAALAYALMRARSVDAAWATLFATIVALGTLSFTPPRPQTVTFVLVLLTMLLLEKDRWRAALLVVVLGVNIHGGVWPVYVLVFAFYEFPKRWWLVVAAAGATLIEPNPAGVLLYPLLLWGSSTTAHILEWAPTALWTRKGDLLAYLAVMLAARRRPLPWRDGALALAFVLLSLTAVRHVVWFYVVVIPVLAPHMVPTREQVMAMRLPRWASAFASRSPKRLALSGRRGLDLAIVVALACAALLAVAGALSVRPDVSKGYPQPEVLAYLKARGAQRVFNVWGEGGYLILNGVRPMIDGRFDPYLASKPGEQDLAQEYTDLDSGAGDIHGFVAKLRVDYVLARRGRLTALLQNDPAFVAVMTDAQHVVYRCDLGASVAPTATAAP